MTGACEEWVERKYCKKSERRNRSTEDYSKCCMRERERERH